MHTLFELHTLGMILYLHSCNQRYIFDLMFILLVYEESTNKNHCNSSSGEGKSNPAIKTEEKTTNGWSSNGTKSKHTIQSCLDSKIFLIIIFKIKHFTFQI